MAKREARLIFDLSEKEKPEELTPLRLQELAVSEELKKTVKLPAGRSRRDREDIDKPVTAFVDELVKSLGE